MRTERKAKAGYSKEEAVKIVFLWVPLVFIGMALSHAFGLEGKGLWALCAEREWGKFWQRCALMVGSVMLYVFLLWSLTR